MRVLKDHPAVHPYCIEKPRTQLKVRRILITSPYPGVYSRKVTLKQTKRAGSVNFIKSNDMSSLTAHKSGFSL